MNEWLFLQDGAMVYVVLFLLLMGGAIGLPIPEDIPLVLGGILAHRGNAKTEWIFVTCYLGIVIGDLIIFSIGRKLGPAMMNRPWVRARISPTGVERAKKALEKRSLLTIFLARHLFYLRTVTFLTCGLVRMSYKRFMLADAFAALISAAIMMHIGYIFSENYEALRAAIKKTKNASLVIALILLVGILIYMRHRRRKATETLTPEDPTPLQ